LVRWSWIQWNNASQSDRLPDVPKGSEDSRALGRAFRATREEKGYTQESFALKAGIDRSYYGALERGEHNSTIETIMEVARGLDVPAWELWERAGL
jgi:DNA-binding XRE family transcriptional regulator